MTQLKIANWNIEWMNRWFNSDQVFPVAFKTQQEAGFDVEKLAKRVAKVIEELDADFVTIQEGPSRRAEMMFFVEQCLDDSYTVWGPIGKGQQKLYTLQKKNNSDIDEVRLIREEFDFDFADPWDVDIDADLILDEYRFTRPPLVVGIKTVTGRFFRLMSFHAKSKYVHNGRRLWEDPHRRQDFIELALKARRRISAEAMRIREYLDLVFKQENDAGIIVTGDFNDGPGLDFFESRYLTHNVAGLIAGSPYIPQTMLRHGFVDLMDKNKNYTAQFFDFIDNQNKKILLDHIFLSASLFWTGDKRTALGKIEHEIYEKYIEKDLEGRPKLPSDHRPQTLTFEV